MLNLKELENVKDSVKFGIQGINSLLEQIPNLKLSLVSKVTSHALGKCSPSRLR